MTRTAGQYCSRDSMYRFQNEEMTPPLPLVDADDVRKTAMTWQQKQAFGTAVANQRKAKGVQWQPLDINAVKDPAVTDTTSNGESWSEQRAKLDTVSSRQPREKTAANPPLSSPPASIGPSLPDSQHDAETPQKKRSRQHSKKKTTENKDMAPQPDKHMVQLPDKNMVSLPDKNMASLSKTAYLQPHQRAKGSQNAQLPKSAYIPPYLRKNNAAHATTNDGEAMNPSATLKNGEQTANPAAGASTVESTSSKLENTANFHSSPYRASHGSTISTSVHTTPKDHKPSTAGKPRFSALNVSEKVVATPKTETTNDESYPGWDVPKPSPPPAAPKSGNPRWPRTRGPPKKTAWPKQREMKALPSVSDSDGGVSFKSDSNGDPNYDVKKLMDWNGDWLPPPEQWSARKGHSSRHFGQGIEQWINGHPEECLHRLKVEPFFEKEHCNEVVPQYWKVSQIEQKSLGEFWKTMPTRQPSALSDVSAHPPFWERYEDASDKCFLVEGLVVPGNKVDPDDPNNHMGRADLLVSATEKLQGIKERDQRKLERKLAKQARAIPETKKPNGPQPTDRRIIPQSNVYFRPVQPTDVEGITILYNRYVAETIFAHELEPLDEVQVAHRVETIVTKGLPFLVAVARSNQIQLSSGNQTQGPRANRTQESSGYVKERIVGFACLEDYCDKSSMYRFTFELELYVHLGFQGQNIGSCLLDRLLEMCNTGYNACGGYEYRNDFEYLKNGPSRFIKTMILKVHKEHGEKDDKTAEFLKQFKFHRSGHIPRIGYKHGKEVDIFLYTHTTTETVEAGSRPMAPLDH